MKNKSVYILMYISFFIYSLTSIFSKLASQQKFLSVKYVFCFCIIILVLGIYAVLWQQILKKVSLSIAMANKPLALVLNLVWAFLLFKEKINPKTIMGIAFVLIGIAIIGLDTLNEK